MNAVIFMESTLQNKVSNNMHESSVLGDLRKLRTPAEVRDLGISSFAANTHFLYISGC